MSGHILTNNGSIQAAWDHAKSTAWKAFSANHGQDQLSRIYQKTVEALAQDIGAPNLLSSSVVAMDTRNRKAIRQIASISPRETVVNSWQTF